MIKIKNSSNPPQDKKRQDALEKSKYAIVRDRKETKTSLEKSKRGLITDR